MFSHYFQKGLSFSIILLISLNSLIEASANTFTKGWSHVGKQGFRGGSWRKSTREIPISSSIYTDRIGILQKDQIEEILVSFMENTNVPGLSIASEMDGRLQYAGAYGYAVLPNHTADGLGIEMRSDHVFRVGSISKLITATVMMKMVEQGTLSLDEFVFNIGGNNGILQITIDASLQTFLSKVRVRHVLEHSAGFKSGIIQENPTLDNEAFLQWAITNYTTTVNEPGTKYTFSNFGYFVLGRVIEKKTGKSYEAYVSQELRTGMGIEAYLGGATLADRRPNEVRYYHSSDANRPYSYNFRRLDSTGGWLLSTLDVLKLFFAITPDAQINMDPQGYLKQDTVTKMLTPNTNLSTNQWWQMALGWRVFSGPTLDVWHMGDFDGILAHVHAYTLRNEETNQPVRYSYVMLMNRLGSLGQNQHNTYVNDLFMAFTGAMITAQEYSIPKGPIPVGTSDYTKILSEADRNSVALLVRKCMETNNFPGMSIAFSRNGKLVYANGFGYADINTKELITTEHRSRIASVSKPITSIAIMKLVEEGKLSLDDKVFGPGSRLGNIPGVLLTDWHKKITIRHLLQHTIGGWSNVDPDPTYDAPTLSHASFIPYLLRAYPLDFEPGKMYNYSNVGYFLLGRIIEKVIKDTEGRVMTYEDIVQSKILYTSQVGACSIEQTITRYEDTKPLECKYYSTELREMPYVREMSRRDALGGWIASAIDLLRVFVAFDDGERLLKESTKTEILTGSTANPNYGLGLQVDSSEPTEGDAWKKRSFFHAGGAPGYNSYIHRVWLPAKDSIAEGPAIFTMTVNANNMNTQIAQLVRQLMTDVFNSIQTWSTNDLKIPECKRQSSSTPAPSQVVTSLGSATQGNSTPEDFPVWAIAITAVGVLLIVLIIVLIGLIIGFQVKKNKI